MAHIEERIYYDDTGAEVYREQGEVPPEQVEMLIEEKEQKEKEAAEQEKEDKRLTEADYYYTELAGYVADWANADKEEVLHAIARLAMAAARENLDKSEDVTDSKEDTQ